MDPIQWTAQEFEDVERPKDWFWAVGIVTISLAVGAILINNILLGILILVSSVALVLKALKKPKLLNYEINDKEIVYGEESLTYSEIGAFGIVPEERKLLIRPKKLSNPLVTIPLEDVPAEGVREMLSEHLPEEPLQEPLAQKIMEYLGF